MVRISVEKQGKIKGRGTVATSTRCLHKGFPHTHFVLTGTARQLTYGLGTNFRVPHTTTYDELRSRVWERRRRVCRLPLGWATDT